MWPNVWFWTFNYKDLQQVNVVTRFSFATDNDEENCEFFICTVLDDLATGLPDMWIWDYPSVVKGACFTFCSHSVVSSEWGRGAV